MRPLKKTLPSWTIRGIFLPFTSGLSLRAIDGRGELIFWGVVGHCASLPEKGFLIGRYSSVTGIGYR